MEILMKLSNLTPKQKNDLRNLAANFPEYPLLVLTDSALNYLVFKIKCYADKASLQHLQQQSILSNILTKLD